jgi:hypothetical protein
LAGVLAEMADEFPLIASLVEQRAGGQKRLLVGAGDGAAVAGSSKASTEAVSMEGTPLPAFQGDAAGPGTAAGSPEGSGPDDATTHPPPSDSGSADAPEEPIESAPPPSSLPGEVDWPRPGRPRRRPTRLGLSLRFESRPDDAALGRLMDTTVFVNEAHPAYRRAAASRAEGYHLALTVAMALAPLAVEAAEGHAFITAFLARWGEAVEQPSGGERRVKAGRRSPK